MPRIHLPRPLWFAAVLVLAAGCEKPPNEPRTAAPPGAAVPATAVFLDGSSSEIGPPEADGVLTDLAPGDGVQEEPQELKDLAVLELIDLFQQESNGTVPGYKPPTSVGSAPLDVYV